MLAARGRKLPFVTTLHGTDITLVGLDRSYLPITRFGIEESDGVTSISQYLKDKTLEEFQIKNPIEVIPNFVNCDVYKPFADQKTRDTARERYASPGERILLHLSNFRPVKRVTDTVRILARVVEQVPARLLLVGDGPDRSSAEWLAHKLGIQDRISFLGKQESVNELLPVADLMLMPSELESFGLAALEAMACKVPTVATRVGGVPELIEDGVTGRLFPVGATDAMANAAIELLTNPEKLETMGHAGRASAQARYCASRIIPLYEKYYEEVLGRDGG
jgi:N-acetyl-alpha-D-glucosaminyl L-malate synthase BshA